MDKKEFTQAMNQIHLEASLLEVINHQLLAKADEGNLNILLCAYANVNDKVILKDENSVKERLSTIAVEFQNLCKKVCENPALLDPFPKLYNATFQVLLRTLYQNELFDDLEAVMDVLGDMIIAADSLIPEEEFQGFLYWYEAMDMCWEKVVLFPRVVRQLNGFMAEAAASRAKNASVTETGKKKKGNNGGPLLN